MDLVLLISLTVLICYLVWSGLVLAGFRKYSVQSKESLDQHDVKGISVVIPFRNEEASLPKLIESLRILDYPADRFEILLIDDNSDDGSIDVLKEDSNIRVISSNGEGKKAAQLCGVQAANYDIIACTDADCIVPPNWLMSINNAMRTESAVLAFGPVAFHNGSSRLKLEFMSLIGSTIGMLKSGLHVMGNGANMAFRKEVYLSAFNKMDGHATATGDDVFLLHHVSKENENIETLPPSGLVQTGAPKSTSAFINQRVRWASKAKFYRSTPTILIGALIFLINTLVLALAIGLWFYPGNGLALTILFLGKLLADGIMLIRFSKTLDQPFKVGAFFVQELVNLVYVPGIALLSQFKSYSWKGRTY